MDDRGLLKELIEIRRSPPAEEISRNPLDALVTVFREDFRPHSYKRVREVSSHLATPPLSLVACWWWSGPGAGSVALASSLSPPRNPRFFLLWVTPGGGYAFLRASPRSPPALRMGGGFRARIYAQRKKARKSRRATPICLP